MLRGVLAARFSGCGEHTGSASHDDIDALTSSHDEVSPWSSESSTITATQGCPCVSFGFLRRLIHRITIVLASACMHPRVDKQNRSVY